MRTLLLVQPSLQPPGGGNGVAAWMLQALCDDSDVTVLSWQPVETTGINRFFGTSLDPSRFRRRLVPLGWRTAAATLPVPGALLRSSLLMRHTREIAGDYDLVLGAHNEVDYGRRGIQYVHYPAYLRPRPDVDLRWYHGSKRLLDGYYHLADALAGFSLERMRENLTLANSFWTAARVKQAHAIAAQTLYPPIVDPLPAPEWDRRHRGFLAIGRIAPEKDYERVIRILARVRETHHGITLTIVGTSDRGSRAYLAQVRREAARYGGWIRIEQDLTRDQLRGLMARHRYGIHGMRAEHFGMAAAEMVRAGLVVWVPASGGQVEIVGDEPALRYDSDEEAADRIVATLADAREEARLRDWLTTRATLFSTEHFTRELRRVVASF